MRFLGKSKKVLQIGTLIFAGSMVLAPTTLGQVTLPESRQEIQLSFAPLVQKVAPSVVNVYAVRRVKKSKSPFSADPFFEHFFGRRGQRNRQRNQNALGSGVIVAQDGIVITNHHVIKDADEVKVALADGREFAAKIILKDEASDLAVLKLDSNETFPALPIGDSDQALVGDLVLAIGNPFGVGQTVTSGIISAVARSSIGISDFGFFLQTDAAINPGNSGGALVDLQGNLIGINTAIFSRSGGSNGIGFAIPSNMVQVAIQSSQTSDSLKRPWLGAAFQQVTPDIAQAIGLDRPKGAMVTEVYKDGPAAQAGISAGDVILAINGKAVPHINALGYRLTTVGIGNDAEIDILSDGEMIKKSITLILAPETISANETWLPDEGALAGAQVANLSPAMTQRLKMPHGKEGVVVLKVQRRSPASSMRLAPGDIILELNETPITRVGELVAVLEDVERRTFLVVERRGRQLVMDRNGNFFKQYSR